MRKILSVVLSFGLLFQQSGLVYAAGELNIANYLSQARSAIVQPDHFRPAQLRYISYDLKSNDFKLLLDKGGAKLNELSNSLNSLNSKTPKLNDATQELFNYFLIGLSLPNDTFWVNLRPDAADNIIDPLLEKTDIGKIFLEADLQLKKDTASLTSPQNPEGKVYWDKLYKKAGELFGTENITIPTITRPWIVPNEVIVRETDDSAYIYKATLKVMLEEDYLMSPSHQVTRSPGSLESNPNFQPLTSNYSFSDPRLKELNQYSTQLIKETIIPKLTREVNSSRRYARLRQVYYSLVLSRWFKARFRSQRTEDRLQITEKPDNYIKLIDTGDLTNLTSKENWDKTTYFSQYQESFAQGEYNLKQTVASAFGQSIRSYVSGGIVVGSPISEGGFTAANEPVTAQLVLGIQPVAVGSPVTVDEKYINKFRDDIYSLIVGEDINNYFLKDRKKVEEAIEKISKDFTDIKGNKDIDKFKSLIAYTLETFSPFIGTDKLYDGVMHHAVLRLQVLSLDIEKVYEPSEKPKGSAASPVTLKRMKSMVLEQVDILKNQYSSSNNERTEIENMVANVPNMRTKKELKEFVLTEMIPDINSYIEERNSESEEELRSRNFEAYKEIYRKVMLLISVKGVLVLLTKEDTHYSGAASPIILIDKDRMKIEEIDENIKMGYAEVRLLSVYHTDLYKAYEKIAIKSRDMVAIAEAIKEVYEVVVGFSLTGDMMIGGIKKKEAELEVKEWAERVKDLLKISKYVRDEMAKRIDAGWRMLRLNEASKEDAKTIINNALENKEFDKAANIMISLLNESMDSIRYFETEKTISEAENMIKAWEKISKEVSIISVASSGITSEIVSMSNKNPLGGIDFTDRAMRIKLERVGSFASSALVLPEIANVEALDLDKEFEQIQVMVSSSIRPSDTRILEFAAACYYRGEFDNRLEQVSSCVKAAHLADERLGKDSSDTLRLATMLPDALYGGRI